MSTKDGSKKRASSGLTSTGSSSSLKPKSKQPSIDAQLSAIVTELNRTVPPGLQKNLGLIKRLDALSEGLEDTCAAVDGKTRLIIAHLKEDLAKQTYELIDNQIRKLDSVLSKFDALEDVTIRRKLSDIGKQKRFRSEAGGGIGSLNMDVDPSEPTYCICGQVAFGEMISCDNADCEREWFHVQCVGKPDNSDTWLCPDCSKKAAALASSVNGR